MVTNIILLGKVGLKSRFPQVSLGMFEDFTSVMPVHYSNSGEIMVYLTIIPWVRVGYEMTDSAELAIIIPYPTSASGIIVLLKATPKHHAYACHFCRSWYNGSYTTMVKTMKTLELHYPMIQLLIKGRYIQVRL